MTTLAPIRAAAPKESPVDRVGCGPTLDELVVGLWDGLSGHAVVRCPVCGDDMEPRYGAHAIAVQGRCTGCGSVLS